MIRVLLFILFMAVLAGIYFIIRKMIEPSDSIICSRCDGKGFWLAARGREKCDWCNGTGRLPKSS